jgi:hypothetical protein
MVIPSVARNLPVEALIMHFFRCDIRSLREVAYYVRDDTLNVEAQSVGGCETPNSKSVLSANKLPRQAAPK